jgi:neutral ceramidase
MNSAVFNIGTGIYDITGPAAEVGMMGMSQIDQKTTGILSRLFSRAFVVEDPSSKKRVAIVSADIWSCTQALKTEVVKRLKKEPGGLFTTENVLLSGTHTHSGPGGFSHYALYNLSVLGFIKQNFDCIVDGVVKSIVHANQKLTPGEILVSQGQLLRCGENRSCQAYQNNPEEERKKYDGPVDREMLLLKFVSYKDGLIGMLNWFPIHPTSLGVTNRFISGDSKGYASYLFERDNEINPDKKSNFIAAFANSNAGDVSGNIKYDVSVDDSLWNCGDVKYAYDIPNGAQDLSRMQEYGEKQYRKAKELFNCASEKLSGPIDFHHTHVDMSNVSIEGTPNRTWPAALGLSMFHGSSADSPPPFEGIPEGITRDNFKELAHPVIPAIRIAFLGLNATIGPVAIDIKTEDDAANIVSGWFVQVLGKLIGGDDVHIKAPQEWPVGFKDGHGRKLIALATGLVEPYPFTPQILPLQLVRLGSIVLAAIPGEITTMAARRLRESILNIVGEHGINIVALSSQSNAYAGYITTHEEYAMQYYPGASNHFGPYSLMAYQQEFSKLADALVNGKSFNPGPDPKDLSKEQHTMQTDVVMDAPPIGKKIGDVEQQVAGTYSPGSTVSVSFWAGHPKNDLRTGSTYLEIQRKVGSGWETVYTDNDSCTRFEWERKDGLWGTSLATITWSIPLDASPGDYRIVHAGSWKKGLDKKIYPYEGASNTLKVSR